MVQFLVPARDADDGTEVGIEEMEVETEAGRLVLQFIGNGRVKDVVHLFLSIGRPSPDE